MYDEPGGNPRGTNRGRLAIVAFCAWVGWFFAVGLATGQVPGPEGYPEPHPLWTETLLGYVTLYIGGRTGKGLAELRQQLEPDPDPPAKPIQISGGTLKAFVMDASREAVREEVRAGTLVVTAPPPARV